MSKGATHEPRASPMSARRDAIRMMVLDMLAGGSRPDCKVMAAISPAEWHALAAMARQHRLEPILHRNLEVAGTWPIPEEIAKRWRLAFRKSAVRALTHEKIIHRLAASFDAARLPYAALKGAWLAWHAYPHAALRPLRDIDILVPADRAREAFDLLHSQGFVPRNPSEPSVEHALAHGKHLPGLTAPADKISVEIHHRLLMPDQARRQQVLTTEDILSTRILRPSRTGDIAYPASTEMLLHLVIHGVYEHRFCNGPLVLSDIAHLVERSEVDWDRFWTLAERGGWSEGCQLMLGLVARHCPLRKPQTGISSKVPEQVMRMAALMMLQDHEHRGRTALMASLGAAPGMLGKLRLAARRMRPERHALAGFARRPIGDRSAWLHYPAWLASRVQQTVIALIAEEQRADMRRARAFGEWLDTRP